MTGQDDILKLRRAGLAPACIWVDDYPHQYAGLHSVCLRPSDTPEQQDWRFAIGLPVIVSSDSPERLQRLTTAIGEYASRVIGSVCAIDTNDTDWLGRPAVTVTHITDTKQELTWPK